MRRVPVIKVRTQVDMVNRIDWYWLPKRPVKMPNGRIKEAMSFWFVFKTVSSE